jgi:hypothetical protein
MLACDKCEPMMDVPPAVQRTIGFGTRRVASVLISTPGQGPASAPSLRHAFSRKCIVPCGNAWCVCAFNRLMEHKADHTGDARKRELLDQFEHWLLPASIVLLGLALAFLWYVNSEWRVSLRAPPQVQVAPMTDLPSQPLPTAKRPG